MKIGIDARMYGAKSTTGIGVYIQNLTDEIFKIDQKNEYYLFMLEPAFSEFKPPHNNIKKIKIDFPWYSWSEQLKFPLILNKYNLDLVHFPHFNIPIFYQKRFIVTIHDITPKFFPGPRVKKSIIRKWGYNFVFSNSVNKAEIIIAISQYTKNNLIKYFKIKPEKIEVIYPGLAEKYCQPTNNQNLFNNLKNKYRITKPFLLYVGVWRDHKNLPGLISAFDILKLKYQLDYQLVLGGNPDPRYPEIQQAIQNSKFRADIILPGFINEEELPLFYQAAKLFVLPSFCEGFGLVAVESLACGTPVVGSNTTSLPEILQDAALYFNPSNPEEIAKTINQVLTNSILYQELARRGRILVQKYKWQTAAEKTLAIYSKVIPASLEKRREF